MHIYIDQLTTCLASVSAGGSIEESEYMSAQCEVPGMTSANSDEDRLSSTLSACHGSIKPAIVATIKNKALLQSKTQQFEIILITISIILQLARLMHSR